MMEGQDMCYRSRKIGAKFCQQNQKNRLSVPDSLTGTVFFVGFTNRCSALKKRMSEKWCVLS